MFWVFKVEGRETHILLGQGAEGNETHKCCGVSKLRDTKPIQCLGIEGGGGSTFFGCLRLREGKLAYCWARG